MLKSIPRLIPFLVLGLLVVAAGLLLFRGGDQKTLTADFPRTVALYKGSEVRILGVNVGTVESVVPSGTTVKVTMNYDAKYDLPEDVNALLIAPAIVGDRYVQLAPVYRSGPTLPDDAELGVDRVEVPLELDEIYQNIDDLTVALGPEGANSDGALTRLLDTTARNFAGQGAQFNETLRNLGQLTGTLENNEDELFGAAEQIQRFVQALAENDQTVRDFNDSLAAASGVLEDEREDLAAALGNLGVAVQEVAGFVRDNKTNLSRNIKGLNRITRILVKQRGALDEVLNTAPQALNNLYHAYNNRSGTLDTRANLSELANDAITRPDVVLCGLLGQVDESGFLCDLIAGAAGRPAALKGATKNSDKSSETVTVENIDRTLGGLLAPGATR